MDAHKKPPFRRRRLGKRLRALRESAGLSMDDAAPKLDKSRTSLVRIESGEYRADVHLIRSMMDVYDRWEEGLLEAAREALKPGWFNAFGLKDMGYVDVETEASRVCEFACQNLPGLLQTEPYIRALIEGSGRRRSRNLQNEVSVRLIRQKRLTDEEHPLREIVEPEVMRAQLRHLVEMAALPTVTLSGVAVRRGRAQLPGGRVHRARLPRSGRAGAAVPGLRDRGAAHRGRRGGARG